MGDRESEIGRGLRDGRTGRVDWQSRSQRGDHNCQRGETGILDKGVDRERETVGEAIEREKAAGHQPRVLYQVVEAERESERHLRSEELE
jgi:hypothetical protein